MILNGGNWSGIKKYAKQLKRGVASANIVATGFNPWYKNKRRMRAVGSVHVNCGICNS